MGQSNAGFPRLAGPVDSRAFAAFLSLLVFHVAHVLEEIAGGFVVLRSLGLPVFAAVNWVLFCIPVTFLYFWVLGRRWARRMSLLYAGLMVLNGLGHNLMTLVTGRYVGGYAGGFSGIGLAISGAVLARFLLRKTPGGSVRLQFPEGGPKGSHMRQDAVRDEGQRL